MGIRPVDLQVAVHRAAEIARAINSDGSRTGQFSESLQKVVEQENKQVTLANQSEKVNVDKDGRGQGNGKDGKGKKRPGQHKDDNDDNNKGEQNRGMLDIKI